MNNELHVPAQRDGGSLKWFLFSYLDRHSPVSDFPLDRFQRRAVRIVDQVISNGLNSLALRRDVGSIFHRTYDGQCSEELFGIITATQFHHSTSRPNFKF